MGVRADEMLEHVCRGVDSREQDTWEDKARGEDVGRASEVAGKIRICQASKLAGRRHCDCDVLATEAARHEQSSKLRGDAPLIWRSG